MRQDPSHDSLSSVSQTMVIHLPPNEMCELHFVKGFNNLGQIGNYAILIPLSKLEKYSFSKKIDLNEYYKIYSKVGAEFTEEEIKNIEDWFRMFSANHDKSVQLFYTALRSDSIEMASESILLNNGTIPNEPHVLHLAARFGCKVLIPWLINNRFNVDGVDEYNSTPLHEAARNNKLETMLILLRYDSPEKNLLEIKNSDGFTPIQLLENKYGSKASTDFYAAHFGAIIELCEGTLVTTFHTSYSTGLRYLKPILYPIIPVILAYYIPESQFAKLALSSCLETMIQLDNSLYRVWMQCNTNKRYYAASDIEVGNSTNAGSGANSSFYMPQSDSGSQLKTPPYFPYEVYPSKQHLQSLDNLRAYNLPSSSSIDKPSTPQSYVPFSSPSLKPREPNPLQRLHEGESSEFSSQEPPEQEIPCTVFEPMSPFGQYVRNYSPRTFETTTQPSVTTPPILAVLKSQSNSSSFASSLSSFSTTSLSSSDQRYNDEEGYPLIRSASSPITGRMRRLGLQDSLPLFLNGEVLGGKRGSQLSPAINYLSGEICSASGLASKDPDIPLQKFPRTGHKHRRSQSANIPPSNVNSHQAPSSPALSTCSFSTVSSERSISNSSWNSIPRFSTNSSIEGIRSDNGAPDPEVSTRSYDMCQRTFSGASTASAGAASFYSPFSSPSRFLQGLPPDSSSVLTNGGFESNSLSPVIVVNTAAEMAEKVCSKFEEMPQLSTSMPDAGVVASR